ncbi:MAG TPA: ACT domain-containing protein [Nocardioides sp.]|uniref:ACT domain-containing protein n=1 Tax=uncultured Nocardioides sp. TaxID=198441 RepID=UPI000EE0FAA9|nr:ACT domain-containing protein [uncultured Nocardioides sp.]HCB04445.1 amino acid-binding protein [Nocardioides sp.]HRD61284.1 ACT domain-containing protein [Nocardioides sp.]HRI95642.1 ACT domain-containing protein [Nocardioides sp.]HRK48116.1 ACT domain-containing protein [Nocardioides sp.]
MPFLLRVELPDVPGSLGRVATAIGEAGGDIDAIEIVEKRDGAAIDDVLLEMHGNAMPDSIVSACNALEGVRVMWISRYAAGGNIFLDLEAVEELTTDPAAALDRMVDLLPVTFRADWAIRIHRSKGVVRRTDAAPEELPFVEIERASRLDVEGDEVNLYAGARIDGNEVVVIGRRGGPEFVESELARLGHLVSLAASLASS